MAYASLRAPTAWRCWTDTLPQSWPGHAEPVLSARFSVDGSRIVTASVDNTARVWDVTWAVLVRGDALGERVCAEKLVGATQEFTDAELNDPILRGIDKADPVARNLCLQRGPLSLDYWTRLPVAILENRCIWMSLGTESDALEIDVLVPCAMSLNA